MLTRRLDPRDDRGMSLMELVVGMAIMMVFLSIFTGAMMMMSRSESKARTTADTATQVNQAFIWFDKTVRYASAISAPGTSAAGDWYVELRNTGTATERCTQVRLTKATGLLQRRSWSVTSGTVTPEAWVQVASGFTNGTAAADSELQPFYRPDKQLGAEVYQQLRITLKAEGGGANSPTASKSSFTFTAVNSPLPAPTSPICQEAGRP
jgi:Na+-transporting methylmalonyl-CoA/oxaloacetate decarboxylase gamma subunit